MVIETKENKTTLFGMETGTELDLSELEKYYLNEAQVGTAFGGTPQISIYRDVKDKNTGEIKKYSQALLRLINEENGQHLDIYMNMPKIDEKGVIKNLNHGFEFYRTAYDFVFSLMHLIDPSNILDAETGQEINTFKTFNIQQALEFIGNKEWVDIVVTKVSEESEYNSFKITKIV